METSTSERDSGSGPRVDWGDALAVPTFYGREEELSLLSQWVVQKDCHVISVLGMGGIGKSALALSSAYQLSRHFEVVIFRSLRDAPSCEALLDDCIQVLSPQSPSAGLVGQGQGPVSTERRICLLLERLRQTRTLLVLDNLESLLEVRDVSGHLRPEFEGYGLLLRRVVETVHQSCLLLTSREKPTELRLLEGRYSSVRSLRLTGLDVVACKLLLEEKGVVGAGWESLIGIYGGNPLALKIVAETIVDLFGSEVSEFLAEGEVIYGSITDLLDEQFARLSALEKAVLYWLAIGRESVTLKELLALMVPPLPRIQVLLEAIDCLRRRSLIERGKRQGSFTLQSVVLEYVTALLIAEASREIQQGRLDRLIQYSLEQARAKEYVRQTQERLLVGPLLVALRSAYGEGEDGQAQGTVSTEGSAYGGGGQGAVGIGVVEGQLVCLLDQLRKEAEDTQGYGPANLVALLRLLRGHLNGLDLSRLSMRGAYLQNIEMHGASLAGGLLRDSVFTEAISATGAVAISRDGTLWAAGGIQGKVRIWNERGQTLHLLLAHTDIVQALTFSPDGRTLGSGSLDGTVKLWDMESGALCWTGLQRDPVILAFSPDASLLASAGMDATVRLWDPQSGKNLQTLAHPGDVFALTWSPDGSLLASGCFDGVARLWKRQKTTTRVDEILSMQTSWVMGQATGLAFAPDGRTLASANWNQPARLWEVSSGRLLHTLPGKADQTQRVAWSPDGRTLASSSHDKAICLWDVEQGHYRAALRGHTADINNIAFTPDSSRLLSGSADGTLRVWDVEAGQCVHVIAGYAVSLYGLDWSPDGTRLVSCGTDKLVTIWDVNRSAPSRVLRGHRWIVWGVGWSPDGRFLVSTGWDTFMYLWDPTSGTCVQRFEDPSVVLLGMAWSPDGRYLAHGTYRQGVQVWDMTSRSLRWTGGEYLTFGRVAWSPDGTRLVGGNTDGSIYLWEGADGIGQGQGPVPTELLGHRGKVNCVIWSPDGTRLASGSGSGELFVWDVQTRGGGQGQGTVPTVTFVGHPGRVCALAWSRCEDRACPRGERLISGGSDGMLRWWDVETGQCVRAQAAHQGTIQSLRVSPDGRQLASCGDDGAIMIWDLESFEHRQTLRHDRPYERMNIRGIRGLTEAQKVSLIALGAIAEPTKM